MDAVMVRLEHHVAEAADAWLTDPQDTGAYARLVAAVLARREHGRATSPARPVVPGKGDDPEADDLFDAVVRERPVVRLGADLSLDPRVALAQLLGRAGPAVESQARED